MTRQDDNIYIAQVENGLNWLQVTRSRTELSSLYWSIGTLQQFQRAKAAMSNYQSVTRAYPPFSLCQEWGGTLCCDELVLVHSFSQKLVAYEAQMLFINKTETREIKDHLSGMTKTICLTCPPLGAGHSKWQQFCLMPISQSWYRPNKTEQDRGRGFRPWTDHSPTPCPQNNRINASRHRLQRDFTYMCL